MTYLSGQKEIKTYVHRSWVTIKAWIKHQGFPARKIDGQWESDKKLIDEWRRDQILKEERPRRTS